jgi:hypothetical protein
LPKKTEKHTPDRPDGSRPASSPTSTKTTWAARPTRRPCRPREPIGSPE